MDKKIIADFLHNATIEVTPGGAKKIDDFRDMLRDETIVYVTFLPGSDFNDTIKTVKKLQLQNMRPVPHFAARSIPSKEFLEENLKILQGETSISEALLIGGGVDKPLGPFHASIDILRCDLFQKYGITRLGIAGHPEGSPDMPDDAIFEALTLKSAYAREAGLDMYIATQFCFEAAPIIKWEQDLRIRGNELPIHIGIPGLATIKTLLKHAQACGVGPSMRVLARQAKNISKLLTVRAPDKLIYDLADNAKNNPDCLIRRCHMYPLGGLKKSAHWMYQVQDGSFNIDNDGHFILHHPLES